MLSRAGLRGRVPSPLRRLARLLLEDLPERLGAPSVLEPGLVRHWERVLGRSGALLERWRPGGPRVVIFTTLGRKRTWPGRAVVLAHALRLRGADPILIACDRWLDACEEGSLMDHSIEAFAERGPRMKCDLCFGAVDPLYRATGLPYRRLSEFEDAEMRERAELVVRNTPRDDWYRLRFHGYDLGHPLESSVFRFFLCSTHPAWGSHRLVEPVVRRYALAAVMLAQAVERIVDEIRPAAFLGHYGAHISRGIPPRVAAAKGVRVATFYYPYHVAGKHVVGLGTHFFGELADRASGPWDHLVLDERRTERLDRYLRERELGRSADLVAWITPRVEPESDALAKTLGLDRARPLVTLFTSVGWDSREIYDQESYHFDEVVMDAVRAAAERPWLQLAIRVHPGELSQRAGQDWRSAIAERYPTLPENVRVLGPEDPTSSYVLGRMSQAVIVYGSTLGLEMACHGKTVICVGRAPYRGKSFTVDAPERAAFLAALDALRDAADDPARAERARRFAYYYWFMRGLSFPYWYRHEDAWPGARPWWRAFRSLADLLPGRDPALDAICDAVLEGREPYLASA